MRYLFPYFSYLLCAKFGVDCFLSSSFFEVCIIFLLGLFPCFISHIVWLLEMGFEMFSGQKLVIVCVVLFPFTLSFSLSPCLIFGLAFCVSCSV